MTRLGQNALGPSDVVYRSSHLVAFRFSHAADHFEICKDQHLSAFLEVQETCGARSAGVVIRTMVRQNAEMGRVVFEAALVESSPACVDLTVVPGQGFPS